MIDQQPERDAAPRAGHRRHSDPRLPVPQPGVPEERDRARRDDHAAHRAPRLTWRDAESARASCSRSCGPARRIPPPPPAFTSPMTHLRPSRPAALAANAGDCRQPCAATTATSVARSVRSAPRGTRCAGRAQRAGAGRRRPSADAALTGRAEREEGGRAGRDHRAETRRDSRRSRQQEGRRAGQEDDGKRRRRRSRPSCSASRTRSTAREARPAGAA